ncbi:MAG: hypothetical protein ABSC54_00700 [Smithellaceae bacterium]|jgi:hypothetical protein
MMKKRKSLQDNNLEYDADVYRNKLLAELAMRICKVNAISMTELFEVVYERPWHDRVNDTRDIRRLTAKMRKEGIPICSTSTRNGGGYYLAAAGSELADFLKKRKLKALSMLQDNAKIMKISLPNYMGQIKLEMEGTYNEPGQKELF